MKTLQIVGNARYGGATYLMLEWSKYVLQKGWQVDVLSTDKTMIQELQKVPGIGVIDSIFIPREITLFDDLYAFQQLISLLRKERYDVVHTYTATPSFLGRMAARLVGVPVTVNHQGGWSVNEFSPLVEKIFYTPLEYIAVLASTKNICVSHSEAEKARQFHLAPQHKLVTIVNGMNPQPFLDATQNGARLSLRKELNLDEDHLIIGNTGRLVPGKGNETLIESMVYLQQLIPDRPFTLLLAGDGVDRDELEELIDRLNVRDRVRLLGFYENIPAFLAGIDIFVTPSLTEGLSIALLEAMASALPIISSSIPPNAELIEHEQTGLLVPVNAPQEIAQAVARFANEPALAQRCGNAARERALTDYTLDRMFQETWDLYTDLLMEKMK